MKLSEYAKDLLAMVELYGDHDVVEQGQADVGIRADAVRAPRLRAKAVVTGGPHVGMRIHVNKERASMYATQHHARLSGKLVYVI